MNPINADGTVDWGAIALWATVIIIAIIALAGLGDPIDAGNCGPAGTACG